MVKISRNFVAGKMNKSVDERLLPNSQYVDAKNVRIGSTEESEIGSVENAKGNEKLTTLQYVDTDLSVDARCIGAYEDGANETIYWFVHDSNGGGVTGKTDMIVSYNTNNESLRYHIISKNDGGDVNTTLNFSKDHLITGVEKVEDLLFFTDNFNPPRQINVRRNYPNTGPQLQYYDGFSAESILVIKKPPFNSPSIQPLITNREDSFLEDRFVCFAYRYRYEDGEYSATSQFSKPTFKPKSFRYNIGTGLNDGMINSTNECLITYNSGGPLVKSVDLLFKDMENSVIKVIEKLDKSKLGLADDTDYTYEFSNSKIFTVLTDSEILRLYDNVPRAAQAQTLMGNRLMYGNYLEGYEMEDENGVPVSLEYTTRLVSNDVDFEDLSDDSQPLQGTNSIDGTNRAINDNIIAIDLTGQDLVAGATFGFSIDFERSFISGTNPGTDSTQTTTFSFSYTLPQNFSSVYALATSSDFQNRIGTAANIVTDPNNYCTGTTMTDVFNCSLPNTLSGYNKTESGIDTVNTPIAIVEPIPADDEIRLQLPAMVYADPTNPTANRFYEYYEITGFDIDFAKIGDASSLHSNRGYEIGIIYMDEYKRSTTALVSLENTVSVPCSSSTLKNFIRVLIPSYQKPPYWAKSYKFAIKPDKKDYNTIFSNIFYRDQVTGFDYFLLDGENSQKIETGDKLLVKRDVEGARSTCTWTTVLEKKAQERGFIEPVVNGEQITVPSGVYMKLSANNFDSVLQENAFISYGTRRSKGENCRTISYPITTTSGGTTAYDLPAGSKVRIFIRNYRRGKGDITGDVSRKLWQSDVELTVPEDYNNFKEWFDANSIQDVLEAQAVTDGVSGPNYSSSDTSRPCSCCSIYTNFNSSSNPTRFVVKSSEGHGPSSKKNTELQVRIEVTRGVSEMVFESEAQDAEPDLWYESSECFGIENGFHLGNAGNQTASKGAVINTDFFNCYTFGNGVESYRIEDSLKGKQLALGNRATTTNSQLYGEERRFSDITYSGVYNGQTNVNKLNEFNLGLANYKPLEQSFGPIRKIVGRETDILALQEDKISYVLSGKNLLSDAGGGSALTSVPEVLGIQVARVENYGISNNPESYSQWGAYKYFTDAKRGAVIQLKGSSAQNEQLTVVSQFGMRSWFRDLFNDSFNTQKIGGYDPYMDEYVLSSNDNVIPKDVPCEECGITDRFVVKEDTVLSKCYNLGESVGQVDVSASVSFDTGANKEASVVFVYNGAAVYSSLLTTSQTISFNFDKDLVLDNELQLEVQANGVDVVMDNVVVNCPTADDLEIILVQVNNNSDAGKQITNQYRWTNAGDGFNSPLHSETVVFDSGTFPVVSMYKSIIGPQGGGIIPANGATVTMFSNKRTTDTFDFELNSDGFRYVRTDTNYENTELGIRTLLANSNPIASVTPPATGETDYSGSFNMPASGSKLYLIWDYTDSTDATLCYDATDDFNACCNCY